MIEIVTVVVIKAPIETVFDLARDIRAHEKTTAWTKERVVECTSDGLLDEGDVVTFEARHFGVKQRLTSKVIRCDRPTVLIDQAQKGAFKSLVHEHLFEEAPEGTRMTDRLTLQAPLGPLGWIAERLLLRGYMRRFLEKRNLELKKIAEGYP
ncbi:MAG: SRPBCC family protein [Chlorobia bacterium]|nr:SRPBCC family protein [Fimbriimonadaceae bacterium]